MVELELQISATSPGDYQRARDRLHGVFADLPVTPEIMQRALGVQQKLVEVSQHRGVSPADLIIAACAEIHGATLVHYDRDYERIGKVTGQPMRWVVPAGSVG
jgi:predicted nucleic acid-binding protein